MIFTDQRFKNLALMRPTYYKPLIAPDDNWIGDDMGYMTDGFDDLSGLTYGCHSSSSLKIDLLTERRVQAIRICSGMHYFPTN